MAKKVALPVVKSPLKNASILAPADVSVFTGTEDEDLVCGSCETMLAKGVSRKTIQQRFSAPAQLLIKCPTCGKHNQLPAQVGH